MKYAAHLCACAAILVGIALPALGTEGTPPTAVDDYVDADGNTTHIYVLANDLGDFDSGTLTIVSGPSRGSVNVIAHGSPKVKYFVSGGEPGTDTFQYSICNSAGGCSIATVTVNIRSQSSTTTTASPTTTMAPAPPTASTSPAPQQPPVQPSGPSSGSSVVDTTSPPVSTATTAIMVATAEPPGNNPIVQMALQTGIGSHAAGTTIGEPRGIRFEEDLRYLGRTGQDTIRLVAIPAIMVSGFMGFLMIGLPQNALGAGLGFLFGFRRKRTKTSPSAPIG